MKTFFLTISAALLALATGAAEASGTAAAPAVVLPRIDYTLGNARATTSGNVLTVSTGIVTQQWTLVPTGLATTSLKNTATGKEWCNTGSNTPANTVCDWGFYGLLDGREAKLVSLTAATDNDEGFADDHIRILAEFEYPEAQTSVRYEIWAYPGANGIMTRLWFKGEGQKNFSQPTPVKNDIVMVRAIGKKPIYIPFSYKTPQPEWFNSVGFGDKQPLNIVLDNLDPQKSYKIGLSFFNNVNDQTIDESVALTCNKQTVGGLDNVEVKPYKTAKAAPQTLFFDLPAGKLTANTATLVIANKKAGGASMASEVIVYEKSDLPSIREIMSTVPARMPQLVAAAPAGYRLVGYNHLGQGIGNLPTPPNGYTARLPIAAGGAPRLYGGYFAETQTRNMRETPLLREESYTGPVDGTERVGWASFVSLQAGGDGLVMLKESQKCVNSFGFDTGDFTLDANSLTNTGLGLAAKDIVPSKYTGTWGNWTILYSGDDAALAIKKFDRTRFHMVEDHLKLTANTWGTTPGNPRYEAREDNVLREIDAGADIGIDGVCIDDGWQGITYASWRPAKSAYLDGIGEYPVYPEGWKNVRAEAAKKNFELGIWNAELVPLKDMEWNYDNGGFAYNKIDFVHMTDRTSIDSITRKVRDFVLYTGHKVMINWDLTEVTPRVGVYYGREYGNLYLENRRPNQPRQGIYVPYLVLRDAWHAAKYVNLNKIQLTIQNVGTMPEGVTNARQYDQGYATAIALMGSPLFFCEMQYFDEPARKILRPLIATWKRERDAMMHGYVDPIGSEPDDASWTGFQNYVEGSPNGYLMIFRELNNKDKSAQIAVKYCDGKRLRLTDLMTGQSFETAADKQGRVTFTMDKPGDYRFYKYTIL